MSFFQRTRSERSLCHPPFTVSPSSVPMRPTVCSVVPWAGLGVGQTCSSSLDLRPMAQPLAASIILFVKWR